MTKVKELLFAVAAVPVLLIACGSNKPEPVTTTSPPADTAADAATAAPTTASSAPSAPTTSSASPSTDTSAAPAASSKPPVVVGETKDECTPVGVDFEKRARPKLKDCYAEGKKKTPNLEGTVKIKVTVDLKGKIKSVKVVEKTLPDPVAECMLKAVKGTPFPEVDKCWDSTLTIPITFPTPK
jgi:hypothetical protein